MKQFKHLVIGLSAAAAFCMYGCDKGDMIGGCTTSKDCPHPTLYKCDPVRAACVELNPPHCTNGKKDSDETDVDCGGACDACDVGKGCKLNADCTSNKCDKKAKECVSVTCEDDDECEDVGHSCNEDTGVCNTCNDKEQNGSETDVDCGGGTNTGCSKCAVDKKCKKDNDCISGNCSEGGLCEAAACKDDDECEDAQLCFDGACISCDDGVMNGNETAIDCGGSDCAKCGKGKACKDDDDCDGKLNCISEICTEKGEEPVDPCTNNIKDDNETDVDCGGTSGCPSCEKGKTCKETDDCTPGLQCINNKCDSDPCKNGVKDDNETDTDCGSASGCGLCKVDHACETDADCESWNCTTSKLCAAGECTSAAPGDVVINEVFTNPDTSKDMYHSNSKQMKFVELYNKASDKRFLKDMKIDFTDPSGKTNTISMTGCIDKGAYLIVYPKGQSLTALDIDAKSVENNDVEAAISSPAGGTIKLINRGTNTLIHGATLPDMSAKAGVTAARNASPEKDGDLEKFVAHDSIAAEGNVANPHTPGVANNLGIPQG